MYNLTLSQTDQIRFIMKSFQGATVDHSCYDYWLLVCDVSVVSVV